QLLELLDALDPAEVARELGAGRRPVVTSELARKRERSLGALLTPLTYARPVHAVRAEGVWIHEADGARLLDAYNNVPVVGHCQPRVTEAVVRQTRLSAVNARYLAEPLVELAEQLLATFPEEAGLDTVLLGNSGSEANDLAWRLAAGATGRDGALVTDNAYHGVTTAAAALSPEDWPPEDPPTRIARIPPPGNGAALDEALDAALDELDGDLAATFLDGSLMSDGIFVPEASELRLLVDWTHKAGGLYVADEVQAGHGRLGPELWTFVRHGIAPDVIALGKPRGNSFPVPAGAPRRPPTVDRLPGQAEGERLSRRRGRHAARARRAVPVFRQDVLHLRRQPGRGERRPRRARRARRRAAPGEGGRRGRAPASSDRRSPQTERGGDTRQRPPRRRPALEQRASRLGRRRAARRRRSRWTDRQARRRSQDPA